MLRKSSADRHVMEGRLSSPAIWIVNTISDDGLPVSQTASQPFVSWATKVAPLELRRADGAGGCVCACSATG